MKKRLLSALLALAMVVSAFVCVPFSVAAAVEVPEGSFASDSGFALGLYSLKGAHKGTAAAPITVECDFTIPDIETFTGGTIGWGASSLLLSGVSHWRDLAVMIQLNAGTYQYRNGGEYAETSVPYVEGTAHFRLTIDTSSKTYSCWYTAPGSSEEVQFANNANFRSDTADKSDIGVVSLISANPMYISNHYVNGVLVPDPDDKPVERDPVILRVGPGHPYATPAVAMADAQEGDVIEIDAAGTYYGKDALLPIAKKNITIRGINGTPKMEVPTDVVVGGKGIWLIMQGAENITIENIHFYGANGSGSNLTNAAGIRLDAGMKDVNGEFKFINCKFEHCNNGLLGGMENLENNETYSIRFEHCEFYDLGYLGNPSTDKGYTHGIYVGQATQLIYRYNYSHYQHEGHLVKTRAQNSFIEYNYIADELTNSNTAASANVDFPNAGNVYVIGNVMQKGIENYGANHYIVKYGHERNVATGANLNRGTHLYVVNNTLVSDRLPTDPHRAEFVACAKGTDLTVINNIFAGKGGNSFSVSSGADSSRETIADDRNNIFVPDAAGFFANAAAYDYHLTPASTLAIDKGTEDFPEAFLSEECQEYFGIETYSLRPVKQYTFRDAEDRPVDGAIDIGAYEFVKVPGVEPDPLFGRIEGEALEADNATNIDALTYPNWGKPDGRYATRSDYFSKNTYSQVAAGTTNTYVIGKVAKTNTLALRYGLERDSAMFLEMDIEVNGVVASTVKLHRASTNTWLIGDQWSSSLAYVEFPVTFNEGDTVKLICKNTTTKKLVLDYIELKNIDKTAENYRKIEAESLEGEKYQGPNAHTGTDSIGAATGSLYYVEVDTNNSHVDPNNYSLLRNYPYGQPKLTEHGDIASGGAFIQVNAVDTRSNDARSWPEDYGKDSGAILHGFEVPADGKYNFRLGMMRGNTSYFSMYIKDEGAADSTYVEIKPPVTAEYPYTDAIACVGETCASPSLCDWGVVELTKGKKDIKIVAGNKSFYARACVWIDYFELIPASSAPAPVAIEDVTTGSVTADSVTLSWTAPEGVASYDVRYSAYPITEDNWKAAQKIIVSDLVAAGETQTAKATGLSSKVNYYFAVKWSNADMVVSPVSNMPSATTADNIAPAAVVLESDALALTKGAIKLNWRAVGDDGMTGAAASYELRYSESAITAENFGSATLISGTPTNLAARTFATIDLSGLSEQTTYYFAIVAKDAAGNVSELSDVLEVTTKAAEPPAKIVNLVASPVSSTAIRLTWIAVGDDKFVGTAGSYDLRMSEEPITAENFEAATKLEVAAPQVSGSEESFHVSGLDQNTTYYFALKVISCDGEFVSELSNVASARPYADKGALRAAIADANVKVETNYTDDSWAVFAAKLANAVAVNSDPNATVAAVATATSELIDAMNALQYKDSNVIMADLVAPIDNVVFYPANIVFKVALTPVKDMNMLSLAFNYDPAEISFVSLDSKYEKLEVFQLSVDEELGKITAMLVVKGSLITTDEAADYVELTFVPVDPDKIMGEGEYDEATPLETGLTLTHFLASGIASTGNGVQFVSEIRTSQADVTVSSAGDFDVTRDGKIDAADLSLILYNFNKSGEEAPRCDIVKDDIVDVADILSMIAVIRYFNPTLLP